MAVDQQYVLSSYRRAVAELDDVESMWNPFQLIYVAQGDAQVNQWATFITSMVRIGAAVLVVMALLRLISILMDELHNVPASTAIIGVLLEIGFCGAVLYNYTWFAELLPDIFHRLTRAIYSGYDRALLRDVADGLSVAALEKTSEDKWHSLNLAMASIPQFISALVTALATCLLWVVSKYQAVLYTFWYLIGPFLIPFYLFRPFRSVAVGWFRSLLGAAFMGVVGSILFILLQRSGWIMNAFASGHNGSYITSLVFGLCCLFLIFSIPSLSQSIWNGISASLSRGAYATSSALASGIGAGVAAAGGVAVAGGLSARGLGGGVGALARYRQTGGSGMGFGDRVYDAIRQRSAALRPEGVMGRIHDAGSAMAQVGTSAVLSQLPSSISRAANSFRRGSKPTTAQRLKESARARDAIQSRIKDRFGEAAAQGLDFSKWNFSRRPEESFDEAVERHLDRFQRQEQNKKDVGDIKNTIQARIKDGFGEAIAQNLDYENWNFSRRPEESLDKAVDRHLERFQRQAQNAKDTSDIRDQLLKAYGEKDASQVYIDPKRNWNLPQDESRADAIALAARLAYSRSRMLSDVGAVRKAAQAIVGPERADKINWGEVRPLTLKKGQDQESAAKEYAMTLLYKARAFTPEETKSHDHAALRREMARKMGGEEKISGIKIPDEWRVQARRGQKREDAIRGSALALLQHLGKVDRAGENRVAEVHSVRARTRKKKGPETTPNTPQA